MAEKEYIEREALLKSLVYAFSDEQVGAVELGAYWDHNLVREVIRKELAADVEPVKRGKWVEDEGTYPGPGLSNYKCSACEKIIGTWKRDLSRDKLWRYCPNCGVKMDGGNNA